MTNENKELLFDLRIAIKKARDLEVKAQIASHNVFCLLEELSIDPYDVPDTEDMNNDNFTEYIEGYIDNGEGELKNIMKSIGKKVRKKEGSE